MSNMEFKALWAVHFTWGENNTRKKGGNRDKNPWELREHWVQEAGGSDRPPPPQPPPRPSRLPYTIYQVSAFQTPRAFNSGWDL